MCDSWTGPTRMSVINFLIYCNGVMWFHKSIDATGRIQNAAYLFKEIRKVVEEIGPENVVHVVTDNGSNYKKACNELLSDLREATGNDSISDWARQNIGDTHLGKRKLHKGPKKGDSKRRKGKGTAKPVSSDTETDDGEGERSPPYQESEDSSSADDGDDGDGAQPNAGGGGSGADDAAGGSGHARGVRFTGIYCTYKYTHISDY
ncbi:uncharacterized protein LOC120711904 [Panicum virgatum]|uniref:uncharacterized protein LOC120711904 n=1 Tax=Panicum virgatum TaxID=38727 RepID=UPI0019D585EA|nr:uncharacterized protein LOC120711904 [Panicum virgatum]